MKMDLKTILGLLVGAAAVLALLAMFMTLGLPAIVSQIGGILLIAGGLLMGAEALGWKVL